MKTTKTFALIAIAILAFCLPIKAQPAGYVAGSWESYWWSALGYNSTDAPSFFLNSGLSAYVQQPLLQTYFNTNLTLTSLASGTNYWFNGDVSLGNLSLTFPTNWQNSFRVTLLWTNTATIPNTLTLLAPSGYQFHDSSVSNTASYVTSLTLKYARDSALFTLAGTNIEITDKTVTKAEQFTNATAAAQLVYSNNAAGYGTTLGGNNWTGTQIFNSAIELLNGLIDGNLSFGTSGQVLQSRGVGQPPIWTTAAATGQPASATLTNVANQVSTPLNLGGGTNLPATSVLGAVAQATHATNADFATTVTGSQSNLISAALTNGDTRATSFPSLVLPASQVTGVVTNNDTRTINLPNATVYIANILGISGNSIGYDFSGHWVSSLPIIASSFIGNLTGTASQATHATNADLATVAITSSNVTVAVTNQWRADINSASNGIVGGLLPVGLVLTNLTFTGNNGVTGLVSIANNSGSITVGTSNQFTSAQSLALTSLTPPSPFLNYSADAVLFATNLPQNTSTTQQLGSFSYSAGATPLTNQFFISGYNCISNLTGLSTGTLFISYYNRYGVYVTNSSLGSTASPISGTWFVTGSTAYSESSIYGTIGCVVPANATNNIVLWATWTGSAVTNSGGWSISLRQ